MSLRIVWLMLCVLSLITAFGPIRALKYSLKVRILLGLLAFSCAQGYVLQKLFDASVMCPDKLPFILLVLAKWGDIITLTTGVFAIVWWLLRAMRIKCPALLVLLCGMGLGSVMLLMGERQPPIREYTLAFPDLPQEADGLKVAVVADLHLDCWRGKTWCTRFVERLNAMHPDVVFFTGDQADGEFERRAEDISPLAEVRAPLGRFVISGNHEYFWEAETYLKAYEALGMTVLDGRMAEVRGLTVLGIGDGASLTESVNGDQLERMMTMLSAEAFPILLVHKPGIARDADRHGVKLQFSGHTHGGHFPGLAMSIAAKNDGFVRGFYTLEHGMKLFVAPGSAAWIGFPYRLYSSELSVFTLKRGS